MTELDPRTGAGDPDAMVRRAVSLAGQGDLAAARELLAAAADAGSADALFVRGVVEESAGRAQDGLDWYLRAAEAGSADAMFNLAMSAAEAGQDETADAWLGRAAQAGSANAAHNLGARAQKAGNLAQAQRWFGQAAQAGLVDAMSALAAVLAGTGEYEQSAQWYARAFAQGLADPEAEYFYGKVLERLDRGQEARAFYLRAARGKHVAAATALGDRARAAKQQDEAEYWYSVAGEAGSAAGLFGLGLTRADRGDYAGAERATRQAAELGDIRAMDTLGGLEESRGNRAEALAWYGKAADAGLSRAAAARDRLAEQADGSGAGDADGTGGGAGPAS